MCIEIECNDKPYAKGICQTHYNRMMSRKYRLRQKEVDRLDSPPPALREQYYADLWEFVKKELKIKC